MRRHLLISSLALVLPFGACGDDGGGKVASDTGTDVGADTGTATDTGTGTGTTDTGTATTTAPDTSTTQDTNVQDTGPDESAGTCPGIINCFGDCPSPVTQACQTACLSAGSTAEQAAVAGIAQCQVGCFPKSGTPPTAHAPATTEEWRDTFDCLYENCVEEEVVCQAGATHGAGNCLALNNCLVACDADDIGCGRDCAAAATEDAATNLFKLDFCVQAQCYDTETNPHVTQACATQAQQVQPCSLLYTQCLGDVGAAPKAGGGGGSEAGREQFERDQEKVHRFIQNYPFR